MSQALRWGLIGAAIAVLFSAMIVVLGCLWQMYKVLRTASQ